MKFSWDCQCVVGEAWKCNVRDEVERREERGERGLLQHYSPSLHQPASCLKSGVCTEITIRISRRQKTRLKQVFPATRN